jgi:hypothetical protein
VSTVKSKPASQDDELKQDTPKPKESAPELKDSAPELKAEALGATPFDLVNPGPGSVNYDIPGHTLDPGRRITVDAVDKTGRRAVRNGYLLCQDAEDTWISFAPDGTVVARPLAATQRAAFARGASSRNDPDQVG